MRKLRSGAHVLAAVLFFCSMPVQAASYGPYAAELTGELSGRTVALWVKIWPNVRQFVRLEVIDLKLPTILVTQKDEKKYAVCRQLYYKHAQRYIQRYVKTAQNVLVTELRKIRPGLYGGKVLINNQSLSELLAQQNFLVGRADCASSYRRVPNAQENQGVLARDLQLSAPESPELKPIPQVAPVF